MKKKKPNYKNTIRNDFLEKIKYRSIIYEEEF